MFSATVQLVCDECAAEETFDMEQGQSVEDVVDQESWYFAGITLDKLLCESCYELEED